MRGVDGIVDEADLKWKGEERLDGDKVVVRTAVYLLQVPRILVEDSDAALLSWSESSEDVDVSREPKRRSSTISSGETTTELGVSWRLRNVSRWLQRSNELDEEIVAG